MRIATSSIYAQQVAAIDNQAALYAKYAADLSGGKMLNAPSDDPSVIAQDLQTHVAIDTETQQSTNIQGAVNQLTQTDSTLSSLTSLLQGVITNAQSGASSTKTLAETQDIGAQVDQALQQAISLANTQYNGQYIFAGTTNSANPPIVPQGSPINAVVFNGNEQASGQLVYNNTNYALSTTMQGAFNYSTQSGASDAGSTASPDVFQALINLRNTLDNQTAVDTSTAGVNQAGTPVYGTTTLGTAGAFATAPQLDNGAPPSYSIQISGTVNGVTSTKTYTLTGADDLNTLVGDINADTATTGVTANFDPTTEKFTLTGSGSFTVNDVPTPGTGATTAGNLTQVLNLQSTTNSGQVDFVENLTAQVGVLNNLLNGVLSARATIGARIQTLSSIGSQLQSTITDNTNIESSYEDTPTAEYAAKSSAAQTALDAAYQVTNSLESKTLMDYMTSL
ncbi:MAG TPA: flagellin hook IN motif-containing protein [Candidatus Limnocylindria bacterium]|nr:flagellin hook IN motif-containing protein [Candidatus Limnocylindria bacterium]